MIALFVFAATLVFSPPPGAGSSGAAGGSSSGGGSSGGQNFHVTFGDNCDGGQYTMDTSVFVNSWLPTGGSYNEYSSYWENDVGAGVPVAEGFCSTSSYTDNVYVNDDSPFDYEGPTATTSGSVTTYGKPSHDIENYCSAEGTVTPPLMGSDFTTTTYSFSMTPANQYQGDISNTVGVAVNGVVIFSPYTGVNTVAPEDETLDTCSGHPATGTYHYHGYPPCLAETSLGDSPPGSSDASHSSILGWAWDGFPIYGPWGYSDPMDSSSAIKNVLSSYTCTASDCTDYNNWSYAESNGDLDECNGRFGVTPEFPDGMYYYVFSVKEADGHVQFPGVPYCTGSAGTQDTCETVVATDEPTSAPTTSTTLTPTPMPTDAEVESEDDSSCDCSCYSGSYVVKEKRRETVCSSSYFERECCSTISTNSLALSETILSPDSLLIQGLALIGLASTIYVLWNKIAMKQSLYVELDETTQLEV